ncbi:superoxide dismutase family protein [candidate division KSB1 bacterium]|nr:superoxide dismutase family protein [candidate division KSB1 bacterium]
MLKKLKWLLLALLIVGLIGLIGCTKEEPGEEPAAEETMDTMDVTKAVAEMQPTEGHEASGTVTFTQTDSGMQVVAHFEGVPEGEHGFHIHEFGDCSAPDGTSAGGHFNPTDMPHGAPDDEERHIGDLGNVTADADGVVDVEFVDENLTFEGENSILGKGVILHTDSDDYTTQPTGNAGGRISCGVIEAADEGYSNSQ